MHYIGVAIIGFIVGLIARALHPGKDKLGIILTTILGIVGSFVATFIGQKMGWYAEGEPAGFVMSVVGAIIVLVVYSLLAGRADK